MKHLATAYLKQRTEKDLKRFYNKTTIRYKVCEDIYRERQKEYVEM